MGELISVIVPVYNTPKQYLNECIKSILQSSYSNIEVLIVDDGSNGEIASQCDKFQMNDSRVRVIHQKNSGVSVARNNGIYNATGKYITFVDADDTIEYDMLQSLYYLCNQNEVDFVVCKFNEVHETNITKKQYTNDTKVIIGNDIVSNFYLKLDIGWISCAKLIKTSLAKRASFPERKRTAEDMYFIWQLCKMASKIVVIDKPYYNYRKNETSAMADKNLSKFFDTAELIELVWKSEEDVSNQIKANAFYVNNEIWFIRFMIARGANWKCNERLQELRKKVLVQTNQKAFEYLSNRRKLEFLLLRYFPALFWILAKMQKSRMSE